MNVLWGLLSSVVTFFDRRPAVPSEDEAEAARRRLDAMRVREIDIEQAAAERLDIQVDVLRRGGRPF